MAEYIAREAAIRSIQEAKNSFSPTVRPVFDAARCLVSQVPAADVVEVRHATKGLHVGDKYYCSNCGRLVHCTNYCELCGAKMDGKGDTQ